VPKEITVRPHQVSETLVHVLDSDKMEVDAQDGNDPQTGSIIRIRTRDAIPGMEHLDGEVCPAVITIGAVARN
jgi:hypothetical protein